MAYEEQDVVEDDETLGPCGCTDYHMADCSSGGAWLSYAEPEPFDDDEGRGWWPE